LGRLKIRFPVTDEVALGWQRIDWWYYVLKFSEVFPAGELERCRSLGMPRDVARAMRRLRQRRGTEEEDLEEEEEDSENVSESFGGESEISERRRSEAEQRGRLRVLIALFLMGSLSDESDIGTGLKPFRIRFVRSLWDVLRHPDKTEASYRAFLDFMTRRKLLLE
jgi:hypothetical protein